MSELRPKAIKKDMPTPSLRTRNSKRFDRIFKLIYHWDINVPEYYEGYCCGNGSHVQLILDAIDGKV